VAEVSSAVFLSYASQDAEAAQKIAELCAGATSEVFLDESELLGGDRAPRSCIEKRVE